MKAIIITALVICSLSMTGLAAPFRGPDGIVATTRGMEVVDPVTVKEQEFVYHILDSREVSDMGSSIYHLPIIGPFLTPLIPVLDSAGLAGPSASAVSVESLTPNQIGTLATIEAILSGVVCNMTSTEGAPSSANSTSTLTSTPSDSETSSDGSIKAEGLLDLGSILAGLPIIGSFLKPLLPLLDSIGLGASSVASVADIKSITPAQSATLAKLLFSLTKAFQGFNSTQSTQNSTSPSA